MPETTEPGYVNDNGQEVIAPSDLPSNHDNQRLYGMQCQHCSARYFANGCDIHIRKCPSCQGGAESSEAE